MQEINLKEYDIVIGVDASGSMGTEDIAGKPGVSRWDYALETVEGFVQIAQKWDSDGPTVVFFNEGTRVFANTTYAKVASLFSSTRPGGGTNTAAYLHEQLEDYLKRRIVTTGGLFNRKRTLAAPSVAKPLIIITVTDGQPTSGFGKWSDAENAVAGVICDAANQIAGAGGSRLDIAFSFLRVGTDQHAADFLERLNDKLTAEASGDLRAPFDCVNCMDLDEAGSFEEILIKSLSE